MKKLLIIEDDIAFSNTLSRRMDKYGFDCKVVNDEHDILMVCSSFLPQYILLDMKLTTQSGLHFIEPLKAVCPDSKLVLLTGFASIATAVEAVKLGADDYLTKPADTQVILQALIGKSAVTQLPDTVMSPERLEWEHIQQVLKHNEGNVSQTARQLNMHRRTLQRKLQKKPAHR
ncbi:two-component system response regulator [Pseudoalteromonas citrea]|uniref:Two-component system response regulator n=1 Tax=Pseudoalteromonas citrea TaxID=43655 RepID=A0A5S3XRM1_9GAMM|nr:response regulator [Pseudoalteromonas citrea]TMP42588.1 two-component system response regulator [Pseudoalteromonas citrea]TMP59233.1 two-component system response regulator [Pseudoalteromonas citrea]